MTETSYTAWDDKLYQWPPPDGWYEAGDGKWWPEGYGPGPAGAAEAGSGSTDAIGDGDGSDRGIAAGGGLHADGATFDPGAAGLGALGNGDAAAPSSISGDATDAASSASSAAGDALSRLGGTADDAGGSLAGGVDAAGGALADRAGDAASDASSSLGGLADRAGDAASDASSSLGGLADRAGDSASGLTDRASDAVGDAASGDTSPGPRTASDVLARLTGRSTGDRPGAGAGAGVDGVADVADVATDRASGALSDAMPDGLSGAGDAASDALLGTADRFGTAVPDGLADAGSSFGAAADALGDVTPDSVGELAPDGLGDALPDSLGDAAGSAADARGATAGSGADALGDALPDSLAGTGRSGLGGLRDRFGSAAGNPSDALPDTDDLPAGDDVGAALAETLGARSEALTDPASSGISGLADLGGAGVEQATGSAADAAAEASQFLTADIPASDLAKATERPPTDLDALPPPTFDPPGFVAPAADGVADLAGRAADVAPDAGDVSAASTLFPGSSPSADGDAAPGGRSIAGFEFPPDETLAPPSSSETVGGPAAASLGLPLATSGGTVDPGVDYGRPDETIVAPLGGSADVGPNPAETGQFPAGSADAASWGSPGAEPYNAPPPPADGPGAMPWGQAGAPGAPPVAGGLDPSVLQDNRSGSSRTLLMVGLGVLALVLAGLAAYLVFGGGSDDGASDATGPGSFAEPHARSTPVEVFYPLGDGEQRFVIQVLEPLRDASGQADGAAPAEGQRFAVTRVRVANQSPTDASVSDLRFNAITASGTVIDRADNSCTITEPALDFAAVLGEAGVAEGVVCWVVPAADYDGLLLGIESTQVSGRIHINLQ